MEKFTFIAEPGKATIRTVRHFEASVEQVWKACTTPNLIEKWWGPKRFDVRVENMELRFGGTWRMVNIDRDTKTEYSFRGVYHVVVPNEQVVQTFEFEGVPNHVSLESMRLTHEGGKTKLEVNSVFLSVEDRDGMVAGDCENGVRETYERLEDLLKSGI